MTAKLMFMGKPVPDEHKGGYGLAIEKLAAILGCDGELVQQLCDDPVCSLTAHGQDYDWDGWQQPDSYGWVNVSNGEGNDAIYHERNLIATVVMGARAFWKATATHLDGRQWTCEGANSEMVCEEWRNL